MESGGVSAENVAVDDTCLFRSPGTEECTSVQLPGEIRPFIAFDVISDTVRLGIN